MKQANTLPNPSTLLRTGSGFFKNLKIGSKLTIGFGLLVVLMLLSVGVSYLGSNRATTKINRADDVCVPRALVASHAQANLLRMLADVRGYLALGDPKYRDRYNQSVQVFEINLTELDELSSNLAPGNQRRLQKLREAYTDWVKLPDHLFELRDNQLSREPAYRLLVTEGTQFAGQVLIDINTMIEIQGQREPTAENLERLQDMAKFQGNFAAMFSALRSYVTTRNRIYRGEYGINLTNNQNAWDRLSTRRDMLSTNQQKLLDRISQNREAFLDLPDQMVETLESDRWREDLYVFSTKAVPYADRMQQLLAEMTEDQQTLLKNELGEGRQALTTVNHWILTGGIVALMLGVAMSLMFRENIVGPIRRLTAVAEQIRAGDMEAQACVESNDEIGILAETFNKMTAQERKRAENALVEERNLLRTLIDNSPDHIYVKDTENRFQLANRATARTMGVTTPDGLIGKTDFDFYPPEMAEQYYVNERAVIESGNPLLNQEELNMDRETGSSIWYLTSTAPYLDSQGKIAGLVGIARDITGLKQAEEELKKHRDQLEELVRERTAELQREIAERKQAEEEIRKLNTELEVRVQQRTAELESTNKELREFVYAVSHDLKTPLRGISQITYWLAEDYGDVFDDHGQEMLVLLINRVKRVYSLLDGILEYSEVGRVAEKRQPLSLPELIKEVIQKIAPPKGIQIVIEPDLPVIIGERKHIKQVFHHLLRNAVIFMDEPDGKIMIRCVDEESCWKFSVADTGPGIDQKYHERIFQIFQTLEPHDVRETTGIGLALVKKIVELYGGRIWVESTPEKGSEFFFTFPKANPI